MRNRLFEIIEKGKKADAYSVAYDFLMLIAVNVSIIPLMFAEDYPVFLWF